MNVFDVPNLRKSVERLTGESESPETWKDQKRTSVLMKELTLSRDKLDSFKKLETALDDLRVLHGMAVEEDDETTFKECLAEADSLSAKIDAALLEASFTEKHDHAAAILSIHPGAGGTEACDWVSMLYRMYLRWAERSGYDTQILDLLPGDEAGIKSVTFQLTGPFAYGKLSSERGVHRLVRISPYDSAARRHTSFASVEVMPEVEDDIEVVIDEDDLRIDTFRSSGAGGQHVNVTDSAVRITHLPSGLVVSCQNERSQIKNRSSAMKILKSRLYTKMVEEREKEMDVLRGIKKEIAWGSQIRSYTLQPYTMVKDHRTGAEVSNAPGVLDGDIDPFINAWLKWKMTPK